MAKRNKDFDLRMQGMLYAYKLAKEEGIEALEKDIKTRGVLCTPLRYTKGEIDKFLEYLKTNFYHTMLSVFCIALEEVYGFKKTRLQRFKKAFMNVAERTLDLDYIGENYVTMEDYAVYLNEQYDLGVDVEVVSVCQQNENENNPQYHVPKVEILVERMRQAGYKEAAEWLEKKVA